MALAHMVQLVLEAQAPGILPVLAIDGIEQRLDLACLLVPSLNRLGVSQRSLVAKAEQLWRGTLYEPHRLDQLMIHVGHLLTGAQISHGLVPVLISYLERNAVAGSADIEAEHQTRP